MKKNKLKLKARNDVWLGFIFLKLKKCITNEMFSASKQNTASEYSNTIFNDNIIFKKIK